MNFSKESNSNSNSTTTTNKTQLSQDALQQLIENKTLGYFPIFQVLSIKRVPSQNDPLVIRYRLVVSDGKFYLQSIVSSNLGSFIDGTVQKYCVIQVSSYKLSFLKGRNLLVITSFDLITGPIDKIGNPINIYQDLEEGQEDFSQCTQQNLNSKSQEKRSTQGTLTQFFKPSQIESQPQHQPKITQSSQFQRQNQKPIQSSPKNSQTSHYFQSQPQFQSQSQSQSQSPSPSPSQSPSPPPPPRSQPSQKSLDPQILRPKILNKIPEGSNTNNYQKQTNVIPKPSNIVSGNTKNENEHHLFLIKALNPYQHRWAIKARVTSKSDIRYWSNQKKEGKLFSVDFLDESGEIRAIGFNEAIDKFYEYLEIGRVYYVSKCTLKAANKKFSSIKCDYEMQIEKNTEISLCTDDSFEIPTLKMDITPIDQISSLSENTTIDVLGIVVETSEVSPVKTKQQKELLRRNITIMDTTNNSIKLTLWGSLAQNFEGKEYPVYAFKAVRVSDFGGKSLSTTNSSTAFCAPDLQKSHELRGWFDSIGVHNKPRSLSSSQRMPTNGKRRTIAQIKSEGVGSENEKPNFFNLKASVIMIPHDNSISYSSCPNESCGKKVIEEGDNQWYCTKCDNLYPTCRQKYNFSLSLADFTGQHWFRCFDNVGSVILNEKADVMNDWKINGNSNFEKVFQQALFHQYIFQIRVKLERYDESLRATFNIMNVYPVDYNPDSKFLVHELS